MPKINENLLKLEGFQYAKSLDLNMGYYNFRLIERASNLFMIILPWVKYCYKRLQMGVATSLEIFQQKMNDLFNRFEFMRAYIDDILVSTKVDWTDHVQ